MTASKADISNFFEKLWNSYTRVTPQAKVIHRVFSANESKVYNDHIALRTFDIYPINVASFEPCLLALGYRRLGDYRFADKHLTARSYEHSDEDLPLIFFSELNTFEMPREVQGIIQDIAGSIVFGEAELDMLYAGLLWPRITYETYQTLRQHSEYAAWVATMGLRANHFTISIRHLAHHAGIESVLNTVEDLGFKLNTVGGRIKGQEKDLLVQGSTMADTQEYDFACGHRERIPTCYYEFAMRYRQSDGSLFKGFVPASAENILESTSLEGRQ